MPGVRGGKNQGSLLAKHSTEFSNYATFTLQVLCHIAHSRLKSHYLFELHGSPSPAGAA